MIRFCDKVVWSVTEESMTWMQMLSFFREKERESDVMAIYSNDGIYQGIILYDDIKTNQNIVECINRATIRIDSDLFWETAGNYFEEQPDALLPILDENREIQGFVYNDKVNYEEIISVLDTLESGNAIPALMLEKYKRVQQIVITDLNEIAWRCYNVFQKLGYAVCVVGEKWEWFGLQSGKGYLDYPEFAKLYIYAEGTDFIRKEQKTLLSRYSNVVNCFSILTQIAWDNMKLVYENEIAKLLEKGVHICEVYVPETISNMTELEQLSVRWNLSIDGRINRPWLFSNERKWVLAQIYGEKNIESLVRDGNRGNAGRVNMVPVGNLLGRSLKGISFKKKIYILGLCIAYGYGCLAEDSLYGQLQELVTEMEYQVVSIFVPREKYDVFENEVKKIPIHKKDIVIVINGTSWFPLQRSKTEYGVPSKVDMLSIYGQQDRETMFSQVPLHTNCAGNRAMAEMLFESFLKREIIKLNKEEDCYLQRGELLNSAAIMEIEEYLGKIKRPCKGVIGAIVMNCNPFTFGHRYLVEYAADKVDFLYIFVIQEDRSMFKFDDRYRMVQEGTADIQNVIVVSSGEWIISYQTFTSYFEKEINQDVKIDASLDLEIFARYVAPSLGITDRFVGEEPFDMVTHQYNEQMKEVLGDYGIAVTEIPRLRIEGKIVNATYVRECVRNKEWEEIEKYVPETTLEICRYYS